MQIKSFEWGMAFCQPGLGLVKSLVYSVATDPRDEQAQGSGMRRSAMFLLRTDPPHGHSLALWCDSITSRNLVALPSIELR